MTLNDLIKWAEKNNVDPDFELRLFVQGPEVASFEAVTHANLNGMTIQLNGDSIDWEGK